MDEINGTHASVLGAESLRAADSLRPSVRLMDECSDFCSLRGVLAIDRSSCSMHEYTSSFRLKSARAWQLQPRKTKKKYK